jgi:hypothetical protein
VLRQVTCSKNREMQDSVYGNSSGSGNFTMKYILHLCHIHENVDAHILNDNQYDPVPVV